MRDLIEAYIDQSPHEKEIKIYRAFKDFSNDTGEWVPIEHVPIPEGIRFPMIEAVIKSREKLMDSHFEKERKKDSGGDLINAYNKRYKPIKTPILKLNSIQPIASIGRPDLRLAISDFYDEGNSMDLVNNFLAIASSNTAQRMDEQIERMIQSMSSEYDSDDDMLYTEEQLMSMPLIIREVPRYSVSIETRRVNEPIYSILTNNPIIYYNSPPERFVTGHYQDIVGLLSTGAFMIRTNAMAPGRYLRLGRDGRVYEYSRIDRTATPFRNESWALNIEEWELENIERASKWFHAVSDDTRGYAMHYIIVDVD